jgi:bifunctional non-homologous end joining protein LigD
MVSGRSRRGGRHGNLCRLPLVKVAELPCARAAKYLNRRRNSHGTTLAPTDPFRFATKPAPTMLSPAPPRIAGVAITHAERPVTEAPGHTKLDVVRYHERVAPWLMRELVPRPIALVKCVDGRFDDCFFQKHPMRGRGSDFDDSPPFMRVADVSDVVRAVQNGTYEFHTWGASFPRLERPDRITVDLDPDAELAWRLVREAAEHLRALLERLGLRWFVKTTGGKGLHFVLPVTRRHTWLEVREFAQALAGGLVRKAPALFTTKASRDARPGKVYVDCLRNAEGATSVAAYSLRARHGLPVSMPVAWDELDEDVRGDRFNIDNAADTLAQRGDPWAGYDRARQTLSASMRRAVLD